PPLTSHLTSTVLVPERPPHPIQLHHARHQVARYGLVDLAVVVPVVPEDVRGADANLEHRREDARALGPAEATGAVRRLHRATVLVDDRGVEVEVVAREPVEERARDAHLGAALDRHAIERGILPAHAAPIE